MSGRGLDELGGRKPKVPAWLWGLGLLLPAAAVLGWLYWAQLSAALGPTLIPVLSPVIPKPQGAPSSAQALYDLEHGVVWRDCRAAGGGHVSAEWRSGLGFYRAWVAPQGGCAAPAGDRTPGALRLSRYGVPVLALEPGTAASEGPRRRELCDAAHARGLAAHARVASAVVATEPGPDLDEALGRFAREAPGLLSARPGGALGASQLCNFRKDPPLKPGEVPGGLVVDMSIGQDRP